MDCTWNARVNYFIGAADRPRLSHTQNRMPFGIGRELFIAEKIKL